MADEDGGGERSAGDGPAPHGARAAEQLRVRPDDARRVRHGGRLRALPAPAARAARAQRLPARQPEPLAAGLLLRPLRLGAQTQKTDGPTHG